MEFCILLSDLLELKENQCILSIFQFLPESRPSHCPACPLHPPPASLLRLPDTPDPITLERRQRNHPSEIILTRPVIYFYEFKLYCFNKIMFYNRITSAGRAQIVMFLAITIIH